MSGVERLLEIMARLRDPERGCRWDVEQDFASIAPYTVEEAYEVEDAIARGDRDALRDELGDLLLQVVFHAQMAREEGSFDFADVVAGLCDKLVRRHPHVFGDAQTRSAADQSAAWEAQKAAERAARSPGPVSALDGVTLGLPGLTRAEKLQRRAARSGFRWPDTGALLAKLEEELAELAAELRAGGARERVSEELGDLLFVCAGLARHAGLDSEQALRDANRKFERRFRAMETSLSASGRAPADLASDDWRRLWQGAKAKEDG